MFQVLSRALLLALASSFVIAASAQAAETLTVTVGPDPTEEVPLPITMAWTSADPDPYVVVTIKPSGTLACGASHSIDDPNSTDVLADSGRSAATVTKNWTLENPGTWILCGYLQSSTSDPVPLAVAGPIAVTPRSARATVSVTAPARVDTGQAFAFNVAVTTELQRYLVVTQKPAGGRGCEASHALDDPNSTDVLGESIQGTQAPTRTITAPSTAGTYLLCAYVHEGGGDPAPEAVASTTYLVGPDPCVTAKSALAKANKAVKTAEKSATKYRSSYKRYEKRAKQARGAKRKSLQRAVKRDKSRYKSAVRRRAKARATLATAQANVTSACPKSL